MTVIEELGDAQLTALSLIRQRAACTGTVVGDAEIRQMIDTYGRFRAEHGEAGTRMLVGGLTLVAAQLLHAVSDAWDLDEDAVLDTFTLAQHPDADVLDGSAGDVA